MTRFEQGALMRPGAAGDLGAAVRIVDQAYAPYVARLGKRPGPMLDDDARCLAARQLWVVELQSQAVGVLVLEDAGDALLIEDVAIYPAVQGSGLGTLCLGFAAQEAQHRKRAALRLYTNAAMTENIAFSVRHGFVETLRGTHRGFDRVFMAKAVL